MHEYIADAVMRCYPLKLAINKTHKNNPYSCESVMCVRLVNQNNVTAMHLPPTHQTCPYYTIHILHRNNCIFNANNRFYVRVSVFDNDDDENGEWCAFHSTALNV